MDGKSEALYDTLIARLCEIHDKELTEDLIEKLWLKWTELVDILTGEED